MDLPAAKPTLNTTYQAGWKATKSAELVVKVGPSVVAQAHQARALLGLGDGERSRSSGTTSCCNASCRPGGPGRRVKNVTLKTVKPGVAPAMVSSAGFSARVVRRTRLRLVLTQVQAGTCYGPARSTTVRA